MRVFVSKSSVYRPPPFVRISNDLTTPPEIRGLKVMTSCSGEPFS